MHAVSQKQQPTLQSKHPLYPLASFQDLILFSFSYVYILDTWAWNRTSRVILQKGCWISWKKDCTIFLPAAVYSTVHLWNTNWRCWYSSLCLHKVCNLSVSLSFTIGKKQCCEDKYQSSEAIQKLFKHTLTISSFLLGLVEKRNWRAVEAKVCFVCLVFFFLFSRYSYICMVCKSLWPCRQVQTDTSKLCSHSELPRLPKLLSGRCRVMLIWHHAQNNIPCLSAVLISLGSCSYLASGLGPSGVWQAKSTGRVLLPL